MNASSEEGERTAAGQTSPATLFSVGYGARSVDDLIALLQANRIDFLIDVRTAPYSRFKPEFSREALELRVERVGLHYLYLGDTLGGQPSDPACHTDGKVDYEKVRAQSFFQQGIERLRQAFQQQRRAALMCSEGRPEQCHRSKLIGEALAAVGIPLCHIDEVGVLRSQAEVIRRLTHGQMDLFGQSTFTSRRRYASRPGGGGSDGGGEGH